MFGDPTTSLNAWTAARFGVEMRAAHSKEGVIYKGTQTKNPNNRRRANR